MQDYIDAANRAFAESSFGNVDIRPSQIAGGKDVVFAIWRCGWGVIPPKAVAMLSVTKILNEEDTPEDVAAYLVLEMSRFVAADLQSVASAEAA